MSLRVFLCVTAVLSAAGTAFAQNDRRDRQNPELIVESGGRLGSCDKIMFTADGKHLLAVGDDKVVRIWAYNNGALAVDANLRRDGKDVLRWGSWREQRGAIFALALSPDKENKHLAIGGNGMPTSTVVILERATGKMLHRTVAIPTKGEFDRVNSLWSVAYSPNGKRVAFGDSYGGIWLWDFNKPAKRLGRHPDPSDRAADPINIVRLVHFYDDDTVISVAEEGTARQWDVSKEPHTESVMKRFPTGPNELFRVAFSPKSNWFAAATKAGSTTSKEERQSVILRPISGKPEEIKEIKFGPREFPRAIAFDSTGKLVAVSVGRILNPGDDTPFYMEDEDRIDIYDLTGKLVKEGPRGLYRAWQLAFHPDGQHLAVAAGENHEVKLYALSNLAQPVSDMVGVGRSIWEVALAEGGEQIAFRNQRKANNADPNGRGAGPLRSFDLLKRVWTDPAKFKAVQQHPTWKGWTVAPSPDGDPYVWYAVTPDKKTSLKLELRRLRDSHPRCWTFIPPVDKQPLRLAVGHLWGASIFELDENKKTATRVRLCTGHQADVMSIAVSPDGSTMITGSTDQTIAGWNLVTNYNSHPVLGASFHILGNDLFVKQVDVSSPPWEAGLQAGDKVISFHFDGNPKALPGGPKAWLERLQNPEPGKEFGFVVMRKEEKIELLTTVRHRPLWRFFPTQDNEWVLWVWQNSYYHCSTKGDSFIGWHVNTPDLNGAPTFYRAEQFRDIYERADVIDELLKEKSVQKALNVAMEGNPVPPRFNEKEPPFAVAKLSAPQTKDEDVKVALTATPHGDNPDFQPARVELWLNDFRLFEDKQPTMWTKEGKAYTKVVPIPNAKLRGADRNGPGKNVLTYQVYNQVGGRAEAVEVLLCSRPAVPPRLVGLAVGVNDYKNAAPVGPGRGKLSNLVNAKNDAEKMREGWEAQKLLYKETSMFLHLDERAKRDDILAALDKLAANTGPEDRCIIFLAGHGLFIKHPGTKEKPAHTTWHFVCPNYDEKRAEETSITSEMLYAKLAAIPARKLVILDACHSGEVATASNPARPLVPGGQGPIIIASCDRNQFSYEDRKKGHGVFTWAILEALKGNFKDADTSNDKELDANELYQYTRQRLPSLLQEVEVDGKTKVIPQFAQVPILFAPSKDFFPVAKKE